MFIVVLHLNLQLQWIKTVEMRTKSVWRIKIHRFKPIVFPQILWPKNTIEQAHFWTHFFHFFVPKNSHNSWTQERNHSHPILHTKELTPKALSVLKSFLDPCSFTMEGTSCGWSALHEVFCIMHYILQMEYNVYVYHISTVVTPLPSVYWHINVV